MCGPLLLLSLGLLNEGRERAARFELLRLLVVTPALLLLYEALATPVPLGVWLGAAAYVLASVLALCVMTVNIKRYKSIA